MKRDPETKNCENGCFNFLELKVWFQKSPELQKLPPHRNLQYSKFLPGVSHTLRNPSFRTCGCHFRQGSAVSKWKSSRKVKTGRALGDSWDLEPSFPNWVPLTCPLFKCSLLGTHSVSHSLDVWGAWRANWNQLRESRLVAQEKKTCWRRDLQHYSKIFHSKACLQAHASYWKIFYTVFSPHLWFALVSGDNHHCYKLAVEKCGQKESHLNFGWYQKHACNPIHVDDHLGVSLT